jgi:predicted nucleic acid-binding Zn ribbon protein
MTKIYPNRRCRWCKELFMQRRDWQKFCSVECRNIWHRDRAEKREQVRPMRLALQYLLKRKEENE